MQTRVTAVRNASVTLLPDIPPQPDPWNNEYTVSVSTHYSDHGTLRTGTYGRMLRAPLTVAGVNGGHEIGILSGSGDSPLVSVIRVTGASEILRIQVILDLRADNLLCNLIDMKEDGEVGPIVLVSGNGEYSLQGFSGSAVTELTIRVNSYGTLKDMVRNEYSGRLVDILNVQV